MIKAVAYCRFSPGHNQREESIEAQLRAIHDYAKSNNITIVREYIDRAQSGTEDNRDNFKKMIRDSERQLFDIVLTHKVDRFARNRYDSAIYKRKLRENDIKVIYVAQAIPEGPEGAMLESVLEGMAEYYSKNLAQETMKGLKENAYKCKFCGGIPPLGYDVDATTKEYIINHTEADTVKRIFALYLEGRGYTEIIEELNNSGCTTKIGNKFGKNSIYEILRNEKYTGTYIFNETAKKVKGKFNRHVKKEESEIIRIDGGMPVIIEREAWDDVQKIMNSRKRPGRKSTEIYLLSGILRCGICGSAMTSDTRKMKGRNKTYFYYRCYHNNGKNRCDLPSWSRDDLETLVIELLEKELFSGDALNELTEKISEYYEEHESTLDIDLNKVRHELTGINKKIGNIVEAIANGGAGFSSLKEKLKSLELQKNDYLIKVEEIENTKKYKIPSKKEIRKYLVRNGNLKSLAREELKIYLNEKIRSVCVFPDHIDIDVCVNINGCGRPYTTLFTIAV